MRSTHGLVLTGVLAVGVLFGIYARGGIETISKASPAVEDGTLSRTDGARTPSSGRAAFAGATAPDPRAQHRVRVSVDPGSPVTAVGIHGECAPEIPPNECVFTVEAVQYRRYEGGGPIKFNAVCVGTVTDPDSNLIESTCSPVEREPLAFEVGVSIAPGVGVAGGAAFGLFGAADGTTTVGPGFSVPFLVQRRLRYPLFRHYTGRAGGNILIESGIGSIVARQSVVFGHTPFDPGALIAENTFRGNVRFFVTKPVGMDLTVGYLSPDVVICGSCSGGSNDGDPCAKDANCPGGTCVDSTHFDCSTGTPVCPGGACDDKEASDCCAPEFADALLDACTLNVVLCPGAAQAQMALGPIESDFDIQEVIDALDNETQAIADITEELNVRIEEKITKVFEILQGYLESGGGSAASAERSVLLDKMMSLLEERITADLEEIRGIARDLVGCPQ